VTGVTAVCDAHNDLLYELAARRELHDPFEELWLDQLRRGGVRLQICPMFSLPGSTPAAALEQVMRQTAAFHRAARQHPDDVVVVRTGEQVRALEHDTRVGLLLALEGADAIAGDLDLLEVLWEVGVRMLGPFWSESNAFGDGNAGDVHGGLTPLGRDLAARAAARGFVIDLAHCADATYDDLLQATGDAPVVISHTGCRAVHDDGRNVTDAQLRALAERGGVVGIFTLPAFIDPVDASLDALAAHVEHAVAAAGAGHVGLGGDFIAQLVRAGLVDVPPHLVPQGASVDRTIDGVVGPADWPTLLRALRTRGMPETTVQSVAGGAFLNFLATRLPAQNH
jgi:membrane dipeptidase